jgi:apolipoprotein N-acyltransferase
VRLVQPNARQELKWRPEMQAEFWRRHLEASAAPGGPDVVIWSESAAPFVLGYAPQLQAEAAAATGGAPLILGIERYVPEGTEPERWFNALAVLGPGGAPLAVYDKHRLVPFGEYFPLSGAIARLGIERLTTLTARGFSAGPGPAVIAAGGLPPFAPLICYEAIFPGFVRGAGARPDWLLQVTNDAWFGAVSGPWQHLAQARARAIEQGLPLARAANTGITAMIDPHGRIIAELGLGAQGFIDAALPAPLPPTPYARWGDWVFMVIILGVIGLTGSNFSNGIRRDGWG